MSKQEEEQIFNMAKQDVSFLKNLKLIKHDDRPDFVLEDKCGHKIGLEHFRADIYRVEDKEKHHIRGGHTILDELRNETYRKYHDAAINDTWTDEDAKNASKDLFEIIIKNLLDMRSNYIYESFLDNLHVGIHGKSQKVKGHIQKSKKYPNRENYDLMGFLIEVPVPAFHYYFETIGSRRISQVKSSLYPLNLQGFEKTLRRYNDAYSYQKINGLPITNEIWKELDIFKDIDFIIIETHDENHPKEHHGQYFDKDTPKPRIYPAFSFGFTDVIFTDVQLEHKNGTTNVLFTSHTNRPKYDITMTRTMWKSERRKQSRKTRKHFDEVTRKFLEK